MAPPPNRGTFASPDDYVLICALLIVLTIAGFGWLVWEAYHGTISAGAMDLAHWQMRFISLFTDKFDLADAQLLAADPERVTAGQLVRLYRNIGGFLSIPAAALVAGLGVWCFRCAAPARYCRDLDLDGLIHDQALNFRSITAFAGRKLRQTPVAAGKPRPCDPALNMREWVERWATGEDGGFDEAMARVELRRQLGPLWRGVAQAPDPIRCLFAVFALHAAHRRQEAIDLLGDLSESLGTTSGEGRDGPETPLRFSRRAVARSDYWLSLDEIGPPAERIAARHGFAATALMALLTEARVLSGVLAPAQFAFLKLVDRRLWYALHSLGFPTEGSGKHLHPNPRVEAVGARDHLAAELAAGERLAVPSIDRAIAAIRAAYAHPVNAPSLLEI